MGGALFDVRLFDASVHAAGFPGFILEVFPIFVIVIFAHLVRIIGRIADNHRNLPFILPLNAIQVFEAPTEAFERALLTFEVEPQIIQRIHKHDIGERGIPSHPLLIGVFDIQIRNVIGENRHFVRMDFVGVLILKILGGDPFDNFRDKRAGSGCRIENLHVFIRQRFVEMLIQKIVRTFNHESDNFVGRIDNPQSIGPFRIIGFIKIFIHHFQKLLFFVMILNPGGFRFDRVIIVLDSGEGIPARCSGKERVKHLF